MSYDLKGKYPDNPEGSQYVWVRWSTNPPGYPAATLPEGLFDLLEGGKLEGDMRRYESWDAAMAALRQANDLHMRQVGGKRR